MRPLLCHLSYAAVPGTEQEIYRLTTRESSERRLADGSLCLELRPTSNVLEIARAHDAVPVEHATRPVARHGHGDRRPPSQGRGAMRTAHGRPTSDVRIDGASERTPSRSQVGGRRAAHISPTRIARRGDRKSVV